MVAKVDINQLNIAFIEHQRLLNVVEDVNFTIEPGEIMALLGESGCGKSVMAMAMIRLLPPYARYGSSSSLLLNGTDIFSMPESLMRALRGKRVSLVFQEPMTALNPVLTIREQLAEVFLQHNSLTHAELDVCLLDALNEVDLDHPEVKLNQYPHQLSGGQKQRIVIAMALANHPELLIADEPTTALDVTIQAQILDLLKRLQKQRKMSVLFITHDLGVVRSIANRVCVMYAGEVVQLANIDDFFANISHPYIQQLLASVPTYAKRNKPLAMINGHVPSLGEMPSGCRFHPRCAHAFLRCTTEKPYLQKWNNNGFIRCHLYDKKLALPELKPNAQAPKSIENIHHDQILSAANLQVEFEIQKKGFWHNKATFKVLDEISFSLIQGKTLAVVGESGSGKTTLGRTLLGLYPLTKGEVIFQDKNLTKFSRKEWLYYRKSVQIVFQDPFTSLDPRMTVRDILTEGIEAHGLAKKDQDIKLHQLLEQVSLPLKSLDKYPHEFSGGQRQRISIARALSTDPKILICDEPTSALDVSVQAQILNLFKELQQARGLAYLFITHNMSVVAYLADDVLVMQDGKIVEKGAVDAILFRPKHSYTQQLLASVLDIN
ncbi:MAG: ABC transporter ATP-binding protein [Legionellales bacterium RIFCSPHIGHO2_12_FULL_37_14]|nr:MAG: ABC transporter ATP-binding protein [Legionellales bacterium RIFCSPHIGHO2_12_FULL_37_14]